MTDFKFNSSTAAAVAAATQGLHRGVTKLSTYVTNLRLSEGSGSFRSGSAIQSALSNLGSSADQMSVRLAAAIDEYEKTIIDAGGLITQQEADNQRAILKAGEGDAPSAPPTIFGMPLPGIGNRPPTVIPNGPSLSDQMQAGVNTGIPPIPCPLPDAAGKFACDAAPEATAGLTLDTCVTNLSDADRGILERLAAQWKQLGLDLSTANTNFHRIVQTKMQTGGWTGTSGPAVGAAAHKLVTTSAEISAQASVNGVAILSWAGALGTTKTEIDNLKIARDSAVNAAPAESKVSVHNTGDTMAQRIISTTYNPAVTEIAHGLSNLTDPSSPVTGVPLVIGGPGKPGPGGSGPGGSGTSSVASGGGGGGRGGAGGGSSTSAANKSATDAAKTLPRQGTGDPAAAASNASKNAAAQSGQGNPASAAQSAMSKAGDTAKGLGGKSGASPLTRSAGLGSLADADKSAAAKAASALGKGGGGAGGGGAGGGGGIGKMGGAGIAAAEGSLSARSAAGLSAAERAMAAPQAAPAAGRAGMGSGAPMGGARGGQGSENEKEHKSARYLISEENGEEIAGELPDTAPPVLGGLNLDTTDNPDTTR